jgi:glucosamine-6-phosphate deaminase
MLICDEDATYELMVGTYRYFREIEAQNLDPEKIVL